MRQCLRHFTGQIHAHCELFSFPRLMCRKEMDMKGRGCPSPPSRAPSSQTLAGDSATHSHHSTGADVGEGVLAEGLSAQGKVSSAQTVIRGRTEPDRILLIT